MAPHRTIMLPRSGTPAVGACLTVLYAVAAIVGVVSATTAATRGAAVLSAFACGARVALAVRRRRRPC
jgi:hypothetical protein